MKNLRKSNLFQFFSSFVLLSFATLLLQKGPWFFAFLPIPLLTTVGLPFLFPTTKSSYSMVILASFLSTIIIPICLLAYTIKTPEIHLSPSYDSLAYSSLFVLLVAYIVPFLQTLCGVLLAYSLHT